MTTRTSIGRIESSKLYYKKNQEEILRKRKLPRKKQSILFEQRKVVISFD